jgi:hypothetical protein
MATRKKLKILALHGYRQNGPDFLSKIDKLGVKALGTHEVIHSYHQAEFHCPTAPHFVAGEGALAAGYGYILDFRIVPPLFSLPSYFLLSPSSGFLLECLGG